MIQKNTEITARPAGIIKIHCFQPAVFENRIDIAVIVGRRRMIEIG